METNYLDNLKTIKNTEDLTMNQIKCEQQSFFEMVNVYVFATRSMCIHGRELARKLASKNQESLTKKQMFDTSENLIVGQSDEIYEVYSMNWEDS